MKDLTRGKPFKTILIFSLPIFISSILQTLYNMADAIIVGQTISTDALGGIGATTWIVALILNFAIGLMLGIGVYSSQRFGAKDDEHVRKGYAQAIILAIAISVILTIIGLLTAKDFLILLNTPEKNFDYAYHYLMVIFGGTILTVFYNMYSNILRSIGDSISPLIFLIVAIFCNIGLDFLFILTFKMGTAGAGVATVISQGVSALGCGIYAWIKYPLLHPKKSDFKIDKRILKEQIKLGFPMALNYALIAIGLLFLQHSLNSFGEDYVNAVTGAGKIDQIAVQAFYALTSALAIYVGQNYGAKNYERIRDGTKQVLFWTVIISFVIGAVVAIFGGTLSKLVFPADVKPETIEYAAMYLRFMGIFYWSLVILLGIRNFLQGINRSILVACSGVVELVVRLVLSFVAVRWFGFLGVVLTYSLCWVLTAVYFVIVGVIQFKKLRVELQATIVTPDLI
jgi:putative MATE family efflux protein